MTDRRRLAKNARRKAKGDFDQLYMLLQAFISPITFPKDTSFISRDSSLTHGFSLFTTVLDRHFHHLMGERISGEVGFWKGLLGHQPSSPSASAMKELLKSHKDENAYIYAFTTKAHPSHVYWGKGYHYRGLDLRDPYDPKELLVIKEGIARGLGTSCDCATVDAVVESYKQLYDHCRPRKRPEKSDTVREGLTVEQITQDPRPPKSARPPLADTSTTTNTNMTMMTSTPASISPSLLAGPSPLASSSTSSSSSLSLSLRPHAIPSIAPGQPTIVTSTGDEDRRVNKKHIKHMPQPLTTSSSSSSSSLPPRNHHGDSVLPFPSTNSNTQPNHHPGQGFADHQMEAMASLPYPPPASGTSLVGKRPRPQSGSSQGSWSGRPELGAMPLLASMESLRLSMPSEANRGTHAVPITAPWADHDHHPRDINLPNSPVLAPSRHADLNGQPHPSGPSSSSSLPLDDMALDDESTTIVTHKQTMAKRPRLLEQHGGGDSFSTMTLHKPLSQQQVYGRAQAPWPHQYHHPQHECHPFKENCFPNSSYSAITTTGIRCGPPVMVGGAGHRIRPGYELCAPLPAPSIHDWVGGDGNGTFESSDAVAKACKDEAGKWWPLTISTFGTEEEGNVKASVGTINAEFHEPGTGRLRLRGVDESDFYIMQQAEVALTFIRLRCEELVKWLGKSHEAGLVKNMRECTKDIILSLIPVEVQRVGYSSSVAIFLALLRLFTDCLIKPGVAITGVITLNGYVMEVGNTLDKIRLTLKQGVSLVLVPAQGSHRYKDKLLPEEKARVKFVTSVVDVLEHAVEGFKKKDSHFDQLFSVNAVASIGFCQSMSLTAVETVETGPDKLALQALPCFSEVVAIPCYPRKSREIVLGLATQPTRAKTAVETVMLLMEKHYASIEELLRQQLDRHPYIDYRTRQRLNQNGKPFEESKCRDMDIIYHIPPYWNLASLATSLLISMVRALWRLPARPRWSVAGSFHLDGKVYAYNFLDEAYIKDAKRAGYHTLVVPTLNAQQIREAAKEKDMDLDAMGMRLIGYENVMELVCWTILDKDPKEVLGGQNEQGDDN